MRETVACLIEKWQSGWLRAERNDENSRYEYLHAMRAEVQITR